MELYHKFITVEEFPSSLLQFLLLSWAHGLIAPPHRAWQQWCLQPSPTHRWQPLINHAIQAIKYMDIKWIYSSKSTEPFKHFLTNKRRQQRVCERLVQHLHHMAREITRGHDKHSLQQTPAGHNLQCHNRMVCLLLRQVTYIACTYIEPHQF